MKKLLWVVICCIMTISLVIASCGTTEDTGGTVTEEDTGQTVTTETDTSGGSAVYEEDETDDVLEASSDKPQYGGSLNLLYAFSEDFDLINWFSTPPQHMMHHI